MRLKQRPEDFSVKESFRFDDVPTGTFRVYLMDKQKLSTFDAVSRLREKYGLKPGDIAHVWLPVPQTTDDQGKYLFQNLLPGNYYVVFDISNLPKDTKITKQNQGGDDATDSDADPNTGKTAPTGFMPGGSQNLTLDMGVILSPTGLDPTDEPNGQAPRVFLPLVSR